MASKSDYRIVLNDGDKIYRLFSVSELKNGDLVIALNSAEYYREFCKPHSNNAPKINSQKYSVHRSLKSEADINSIVHTLKLDNGKDIRTSHYTKAIKQNGTYACILTARSPDLTNPKYLTNNERSIITLDDYHHQSTLYYHIVVSKPELSLANMIDKDINFRTIQFAHFSVSILWSYGYLLPHNTGAKSHYMTFAEDTLPKHPNITYAMEEGGSDSEIIKEFRRSRAVLHSEFSVLISELYPEMKGDIMRMAALGFSKRLPEKFRLKKGINLVAI